MDQISYFLVEGVALGSVVLHPLESGGYESTEPSRFITPGHNVWTDVRCLSSTTIKEIALVILLLRGTTSKRVRETYCILKCTLTACSSSSLRAHPGYGHVRDLINDEVSNEYYEVKKARTSGPGTDGTYQGAHHQGDAKGGA